METPAYERNNSYNSTFEAPKSPVSAEEYRLAEQAVAHAFGFSQPEVEHSPRITGESLEARLSKAAENSRILEELRIAKAA